MRPASIAPCRVPSGLKCPCPWTGAASTRRLPSLRRKHHPVTQSRFFNIQIQASWGSGSSGNPGSEAYADAQPALGGFLNSSSSSNGSPVTRLLTAAAAHIRAPPLPGAASPWLLLPLLPAVCWCLGWVLTTGMFTLAQSCVSGMCSVAQALHPSIPLRGASYEDIAVSLIKALQSGTDQPSTWMRPGLLVPAWLLRWCMGTMYTLATAAAGLGSSFMHSPLVLVVAKVSTGLLYASCVLFMLPLGSGLSSLASGVMERWQQLKAGDASSSSSSSVHGSTTGSSSSSSSSTSSLSLPRLTDTSALALKLSGVLAWPCISAAAVLQPFLMLQANTATSTLAVAAPQVVVCCGMLSLLVTLAAAAGCFGWEVVRRQASADVVVDFGLQLGIICAAQAALTAVQLALTVASRQVDLQSLGVPVVSTLVLCRIVFSTWRLWRIGAVEPSVWLQVLRVTPSPDSSTPGSSGGYGGGGGYARGNSGGSTR